MTEKFNGFKNIYFDDVNCVDQRKESSTISIPEKYELNNFTFSCTPPDPVDPTDPIDQPDPSYQNRITERYYYNNETISREKTEFYNIKDDELNGGAIYIDLCFKFPENVFRNNLLTAFMQSVKVKHMFGQNSCCFIEAGCI